MRYDRLLTNYNPMNIPLLVDGLKRISYKSNRYHHRFIRQILQSKDFFQNLLCENNKIKTTKAQFYFRYSDILTP
jgi:hypothetical protein